MKFGFSIILTVSLGIIGLSWAQNNPGNGKYYPDGHGGKVYFPQGDISFADEVVSFKKGVPSANAKDSDPKNALGIPNYDESADKNYTTLGCGGELVLRFIDNALIDIKGPDLYVFEIGPAVEPTHLFISTDGKKWVDIGKIAGGKAAVDIARFVKTGEVFHYVKLIDLKSDCGSSWPGADIDAVGAIGSGIRISLSGSVLFDSGKFWVKPRAKAELHRLALKLREFPTARIIIEGHTDNIGTAQSNLLLSKNRAKAVKNYLRTKEKLMNYDFVIRGYGEIRPVAPNTTAKGRRKNRRVEILIIPKEAAN